MIRSLSGGATNTFGSERYPAAASRFVVDELERCVGEATVLGAFRTAIYLRLPAGTVIGVLSADAVALPIGLILRQPSTRLRLDSLGGRWSVSSGALNLDGPAGRMVVEPEDHVRPVALTYVGQPSPQRIAEAERWCARRIQAACLPAGLIAAPARYRGSTPIPVADLVGRGAGLTPAGDDYLCGLLGGAAMFGSPDLAAALRAAVLTELGRQPGVTTSLSRQLLARACAGDGLDVVQALGEAMCDRDSRCDGGSPVGALGSLARIGHSSGVALATGVIHAAGRAMAGAP